MKKILFLFFFPSIIYGQDILSDTIFVRKNNNIYFIVKQTIYTDGSVIESVDNYGDSLSTVKKITAMADNYSDNIAQIARGYINRNKINRLIKLENDLHQQVTGKPVYFSTAIKDSIYYIGDWKLNFNGEIIDGVIELNVNKRLIFNPDNGKVYTISTNLLLSTFTNQVSFAFNGIKYDLYKYAEGKFATVDGDVRLIKLE
jgi:hypothetical protein